MNIEARSEEALALVNRILDAGELGARAQIATANASGNAGGKADGNGHDGIDIDIEGGDSALLVGRQGQCLDALQFLVGIIVNRRSDSRVRVTLDADGFRRKHRETLEATALDLAQQVIEHNQEAELEPLPARDRLIIHNVLKGHAGVYTYSEGEGEDRHVIISPKESE
ncbi:MAG: KH domain-containing protein [Armatimonadetes bacterium]|nr:KH domain-containing protein [Armatimonadota bacterium]